MILSQVEPDSSLSARSYLPAFYVGAGAGLLLDLLAPQSGRDVASDSPSLLQPPAGRGSRYWGGGRASSSGAHLKITEWIIYFPYE